MTLQPFKDEELNYFKMASLVLNEFPKALRQTFKSMWDNTFPYLPPWNDSILVRNSFLSTEGGKTKVPTNLSYEEWDCTALFQATIYAQSFALRDSKGHPQTLSNLYVKPHKLAHGKFHAAVVSPSGNKAETFALAIDQLRLLRNTICHSTSSKIDKPKFDQFVQLSKEAFKALGVKTDAIGAIGGLTESDFPTEKLCKLQQAMKEEARAYQKFLEGMCSAELDELRGLSTAIKGKVESCASKEDLASTEQTIGQKINDLGQVIAQRKQDTKIYLSKPCLPPMVPHFSGRQEECKEIAGHVTSGSTRIVSIWGSPGFGKTSVAIAVGHDLHSQGLPVYYISLQGLQSTADLALQFLSLFERPASTGQQNCDQQRPSIDDEVFRLFSEMSDSFAVILDNADDLLSRGPKMKGNFMDFLEGIFRRTKKVTFLISTREYLEFVNVQFKGHHAVRISPLDAPSSQKLVHELLPNATVSDCKRVSQICAHVPLAMKILCSPISEDNAELIHVLEELKGSSVIVELLDNPDYPPSHRLNLLFDSSFQRLSAQEKEALVSLCVLPDSFNPAIAAAVLGSRQIPMAKIVLNKLRKKSLLELSAEPGSFLMHPLIRSFANQRGEHEMRETVLKSKARLREFNICRFQELNEKFLTGHSMLAFIDFYKDEQSITQSLIEGCLDSETAIKVFEVLVNAELFLYSVYWKAEFKFNKIYDSAINMARTLKENVFYGQLLVSKALYNVTLREEGKTKDLLSEAKGMAASLSPVSAGDEGKHLCYSGINQLGKGETAAGVKCLEDALPSLDGNPERKVLRIIAFQILAIYYRFHSDSPQSYAWCHRNALQECGKLENTQLLIIPGKGNTGMKVCDKGMTHVPLKVIVLSLVSEATERLMDGDTRLSIANVAQEIRRDIVKRPVRSSLGLFIFQCNANIILQHVLEKVKGDAVKVFKIGRRFLQFKKVRRERTTNDWCSSGNTAPLRRSTEPPILGSTSSSHERALNQLRKPHSVSDCGERSTFRSPARLSLDSVLVKLSKDQRSRTADSYYSFGDKQHGKPKAPFSVLRFNQRAHIKQKLSGKQHSSTQDSYHLLGATQHENGDSSTASQSLQGAIDTKWEMFREDHSRSADTYHSLRVTQHTEGNFSSALQSAKRTLSSRRKRLFGEEHSSTAERYHSLGVTQHAQGDFTSALQSVQRALDIRLKLFGEEHSSTAESYYSLGITQPAQGDFTSALQSAQRALDIRLKLFGEEHSSTAESYHSLGVTQHAQGDFTSDLQSAQRALDIRIKLFGEEHSSTADSYYSLGITQHAQGDFTSAHQSAQRALDIRLKLFGEENSTTAESYYSLGITQHAQGDFTSALQSAQRALDIRLKLFGEEHSSTAESYHSLGVTQHAQGDFTADLQSAQRALDIRIKLFGEEHSSTADSYYSLGITQHAKGDFTSALQSAQRALEIRLKLFGEEQLCIADSYDLLSATQHEQGELSLSLQSAEHALSIRRRLSGEEHPSTADSYQSVGDTLHAQGDISQALQFKQCALGIRLKLFGEEHSNTADSYASIGDTQHAQGDFLSAFQSIKRALDIRLKWFGEEHSSTADSYHSLGVTQHDQGDFSSALQSAQRALDIRFKLFGQEHSSTADSCYSLGVTQHAQGDFLAALQSAQRGLQIRLRQFGEEHPGTADSYHALGIIQHSLGDFSAALQCKEHALDIRRRLFGEGHPSTAESYDSLGDTQHALALQSKQRAHKVRLELSKKNTQA